MQERTVRVLNELMDRANDLLLTPSMLNLVHTWSTTDRPVTLREYIASRASTETKTRLGIKSVTDDTILPVDQLDDESIRKSTLALYEATMDRGIPSWRNGRDYTAQDIVDELRNNTGEAAETIQSRKRGMLLIEGLIASGKVVLGEESEDLPESPSLNF